MEKDIIIGLGGHIDHGKTSLIKAINGFDGDHTTQEIERGITLDISFSNLKINNLNLAFIDVPGHEKLVKNMIAGAFGIDVFLLVIACDDGIMPQTIEHLQIAHALGIKQIFCVLSKSDLASQNQIDHLKSELIKTLKSFVDLKLIGLECTSIKDPQSIKELKTALSKIEKIERINQSEIFRYYIDRSFSLKGIGTVVSGSVISGQIDISQKLWICDLAKEVEIKGMHAHHQAITHAKKSMRLALNLSHINANELMRGFLISKKGYLRGFDCVDVALKILDSTYKDLHLKEVQFFIGSQNIRAKIFVLSQDQDSIYATLKLEKKIFSIFKERFILRHERGNLCSGMILNPITDPIKKTDKIKLLQALLSEDFTQAFSLLSKAHQRGFGLISSAQRFNLSHAQALDIAKNLKDCFVDSSNLIIYHPKSLDFLKQEVLKIFHQNKQALISAKTLHLRLPWASLTIIENILQTLLDEGEILLQNGIYTSPQSQIENMEDFVSQKIMQALISGGYAPLAPYNIYDALDIDRTLGDHILKKLCKAQKVKRLEHNLFISSSHLSELTKVLRDLIKTHGYVDVGLVREKLQLTRKYCTAYLDYLDSFADIIKDSQNKRYFKK